MSSPGPAATSPKAAASPAAVATPAAAASPAAGGAGEGEGVAAAPLDVDPQYEPGGRAHDDDDSLYGSLATSTDSLTSSVFNFRQKHGRTYSNFRDADYWAPNDDRQNDGLDMHHHMMLFVHDNQLHLAPVRNPQKVLDVGTGTGIWAVDFADQYPAAEVIGTDLSPIQPTWTPPNCKFELDDATEEWTYGENTFDFIHVRCLLGSIKDWVGLYQQAYRCLKPGGWLEHTDFNITIGADDGSLPEDCAYYTWNEFFREAGEKTERTFRVTENNQNVAWMKEAGFTGEIFVKNVKLPLGTWPAEKKWKDAGAFNQASCLAGLDGYALYVGTEVMGWQMPELQVLLAKVRSALNNKAYHASYPAATTWTQKPLS